nr:SDR family NAD(P)-dependent oxidoreductase [Streptomyces sp. M1013]
MIGPRLEGKVALITGATGGIGAATAELFAREGARLVITDVGREPLEKLARRIEAGGAQVATIPLDVSSDREWEEVTTLVRERFGVLDVLVNVAGILDWPGIEDTREEVWDRVIDVNQKGTWLGYEGGDAAAASEWQRLGDRHILGARPGGKRRGRGLSGIEGRGAPAE